MDIFLLYLFTRLDILATGLLLIASCSAVVFPILVMAKNDGLKVSLTLPKWVLAISIIGAVLVPTQKDALFIVAGTGVLEAAKTDTAKRIASKSVEAFEKALDSYIKKESK